MKVISGLKELKTLVHSFFVFLVETLCATRAPRRTMQVVMIFSEIMNQIVQS